MDSSYRRDGPGKSPMGMDLVPVYASDDAGAPGVIRVSPEVVNTLGVRTRAARRESFQARIDTVGYVQYDEDKLVHIHPRVEGWVETLFVKAAGDPVEAGQALYELYSPTLVNAQNELLVALARDNRQLIRAAQERLEALQLPGAAIDELKRTRTVAQTITFYAPQGGVIDNLNIRQGFYVQPGTTLMSIGDLADVWVEAEVFERQASLVHEGAAVTMQLGYLPGRRWQGKVDYIYPTLDAATRTLKVRLRFPNKGGALRPNMFAQVSIHVASSELTLLIPKESVIRTGHMDRVVKALGEGRFQAVPVTIGRVGEADIEILEGLAEGEEVVVSAQFLLDSESSKSAEFARMHHDQNSPAVPRLRLRDDSGRHGSEGEQ